MSRQQRKVHKRDYCASIGDTDFFGTIYDGMLQSKAYQSLSLGAKQFYTVCRVQAKSYHGRSCLYKHSQEFGIVYFESDFVFPASHMKLYGYDRSNGRQYLNILIKAGFIKLKESNKPLKRVNVYSFSADWKNKK